MVDDARLSPTRQWVFGLLRAGSTSISACANGRSATMAGASRPRRRTTTSSGPPDKLFVFEIPDSVSFAGTQQDTFENGNFARWTPTAGSFAVATNGATRVLRQSSLTGDAGAYLTALDWRDQSIEADLRPLEYAGNDRWFGLVARRVDARNFYYVTFRAGGRISLRRVLDGVVTELASAYACALRSGPQLPRATRSRGRSARGVRRRHTAPAREGYEFHARPSRHRGIPHALRGGQRHREPGDAPAGAARDPRAAAVGRRRRRTPLAFGRMLPAGQCGSQIRRATHAGFRKPSSATKWLARECGR